MKPPVNRCTWVLEQQNNNEEPLQYSGRERWNSMGIIKAAADAVRGAFADQWLEVIEPGNMGDQTVFSAGVPTRRGQNTKGTPGVVSNGARIRVYPNQFMMLVDGGRVVDYTAE